MTSYPPTYGLPVGKREFVTVIPKRSSPQNLDDLRNISCTMLASKVFESFVLDSLKSQFKLRSNQYGGVKGLGTDSLLVQLWQETLENLEDYRAGTIITSVDYSKAFNRMSYQRCLAALEKKGASPGLLHIVATFLTNRTMTVKVDGTHSEPREIWGGCPQGSILGVYLFNATIDDLEEDCSDLPETRKSLRRSIAPVPYTPKGGVPSLPMATESPIVRPRKGRTRLNYTNELDEEVPHEANHWTEAKWKAALAVFLRFIDDGFCLSKVNYENSLGFELNGQSYRIKHAVQAQNIFRHLVRNAEDLGMVVNSSKTAMMCVSAAMDYKADAFILDADQNRIGCTDTIKALGLRFSSSLDMEAQVRHVVKTVRMRYWTLRNLKRNGLSTDELVQVYKTTIRPVTEYGCVVYHPSLTMNKTKG